jgi:hypothetical protein
MKYLYRIAGNMIFFDLKKLSNKLSKLDRYYLLILENLLPDEIKAHDYICTTT